MTGKGRLLFALALFAASGAAASAQTAQRLTLKEAEQIAIQNRPGIRAAQLEASAASEAVKEAQSAYFPLAFGSLSGAEAENNSRIAAGGLSNPIILDRYANGITVGQLITDFGRTHNLVQTSRLRAQAEQENATATRAATLLQVDQAYFEVLRAQAVLKVALGTVKARQLVSNQVQALAQSKLKSGLDVSFAGVNLAQAKLLLVQAQNDQDAAFSELSAALGYGDQRYFELTEEPVPPSPPNLSQLISEAMRDRPELASQRLDAAAAHSFATAERDLSFPTITGVGSAGLIPYRQAGLTSRYAAAGFNVNIPLFNGRLFAARRAEAGDRALAQDQDLRDLQIRVARDVRQSWLQATSAFQRLDLTAQLFQQASKAYDLAQARYKIGLSSIVELTQAELNRTQAEIDQASAQYDYQIQISNLSYQIGALR